MMPSVRVSSLPGSGLCAAASASPCCWAGFWRFGSLAIRSNSACAPAALAADGLVPGLLAATAAAVPIPRAVTITAAAMITGRRMLGRTGRVGPLLMILRLLAWSFLVDFHGIRRRERGMAVREQLAHKQIPRLLIGVRARGKVVLIPWRFV